MDSCLKSFFILILLFVFKISSGQVLNRDEWMTNYIKIHEVDSVENIYPFFQQFDFSKLFMHTKERNIYGVFGKNLQRIRVKFLTVKQNNDSNSIRISGKTMVMDDACSFTGYLTVKSIRFYKKGKFDVPANTNSPDTIGVLFCDVRLVEDSEKCKFGGIFYGMSATEFFIKNDSLYYNDLGSTADEFSNNQFVGEWEDRKSKNKIPFSWGDYRVPNVPQEFDCGAAEFIPCEEFRKSGWKTFYDARMLADPAAIKEENKEWWR